MLRSLYFSRLLSSKNKFFTLLICLKTNLYVSNLLKAISFFILSIGVFKGYPIRTYFPDSTPPSPIESVSVRKYLRMHKIRPNSMEL